MGRGLGLALVFRLGRLIDPDILLGFCRLTWGAEGLSRACPRGLVRRLGCRPSNEEDDGLEAREGVR
ncbi:MAG: hypothetical protein V3U75_14045 [Methylococcaceae bacterium]